MVGKVFELSQIIRPDQKGTEIARNWVTWNTLRNVRVQGWVELRKYIYATDTTTTTNNSLPWKNTTTIPKLCQINDNLYANYMASMFPKRKWLFWDANNRNDASKAKRDSIVNFMSWVIQQDRFKTELGKCVQDYIHYGNAFGTVEWTDERQVLEGGEGGATPKVGYCGPSIRRINPLDIVFNPTAPTFIESPKIVRSLVSLGEVKSILDSLSTNEDKQAYEDIYNYLLEVRAAVRGVAAGVELTTKDTFYQVDGFSSYRAYMESNYVEILTFYGDMFDWQTKTLLKNYKIMVVDRHKVISEKPNPSYFGFPPIFHVGWRIRQDNLWAMGPLDNLVGMQHKIDKYENVKSDVLDLIAFPAFKIKGMVENFNYGPMEKIFTGEDGDVEILSPPYQVLQLNSEIAQTMALMEEMAGSPKEAMGFRTPGEKTAFEVQRLENAASRIFQSKIVQFEEQFVERLLNAALELSRRNLSSVLTISVFDDDFKIQTFATLTPSDITGSGQIKPIAARHFVETAELIQSMSAFYQSGAGQDQDVRVHMSGLNTAKMYEALLGVEDWKIFQPFIRVSEQADTQRLVNAATEQVHMEQQTPSGLTPDDHDPGVAPVPNVPPPQ